MITFPHDQWNSATLRVSTEKNLSLQLCNGTSEAKITSRDVNASLPIIVIVTWDSASGKAALRAKDAAGKTFIGESQLKAPASPLSWITIGKAKEPSQGAVSRNEQFNGWLAEFLLYASVPTLDQLQLLEGRILREHLPERFDLHVRLYETPRNSVEIG